MSEAAAVPVIRNQSRRLERVDRLVQNRKAMQAGNHERIRAAVLALEEERVRISVAAVAKRAQVSRQTVYNCPWIVEIQQASQRTNQKHRPEMKAQASEASLRRRLQDALDANRRLRKENVHLRAELDLLIKQVRELSRR